MSVRPLSRHSMRVIGSSPEARPKMPRPMADHETEITEEQRHLDLAEDALSEVVGRLEGGPSTGIDAFADEALAAMRNELLRTYTEASGPLYFGRVDSDEETLYVGRHSVHGPDNELLAINWRAPAAESFYTATAQDPGEVRRRRRLDIDAGEVLGFVDEELAAAAAEDHLTAAIVEDVSRARIGEMRQIVSTITADQYELIAELAAGPLVIQGGPGPARRRWACTGLPGCSTPTATSPGPGSSWSGRTTPSSTTSARCCRRSASTASTSARSTASYRPGRSPAPRIRRSPC